MKSIWPVALILATIVGCKSVESPSGGATTQNPVAQGPEAKSGASESIPTATETAPLVAAKLVPNTLRTEGYQWYGLDDGDEIPMKDTGEDGAKSGKVQTELTKVADGRAEFEQLYSGDLSNLPSIGIEATKDGIYITSLYGQQLDHPSLDLPADPKPGFQWDYKIEATMPQGGDLRMSGDDKIIGLTKLKIGEKEYDALEVEDDGVMAFNQKSVASKSQKWFVKGKGCVRIEAELGTSPKPGHDVLAMTD